MSSRAKGKEKKIAGPASTAKGNKFKFALLRNNANNQLIIVPFTEMISAKNPAKLAVGDDVSHGMRGKRIRATIVLLGNEDECKNSMKIIERTTKRSARVTTDDNPSSFFIDREAREREEDDNDDEEDDTGDDLEGDDGEGEEQDDDQAESEFDKENNIETFADSNGDTNDNPRTGNAASSHLSTIDQNSQTATLTNPPSTTKRKSSSDEIPQTAGRKKMRNIGYTSMREHARVVEQLAVIHEENLMYKTTWMPRPTDKATIDYFVKIGRILAGTDVNGDGNAEKEVNNAELLQTIMATLDMTEEDLKSYTGRTILSTARQLIGAKYPGANVAYADVKKEHVKAVIEYAWLTHPHEKNGNNFSKISKAMGNVFATRAFNRKTRTSTTMQHTATTTA